MDTIQATYIVTVTLRGSDDEEPPTNEQLEEAITLAIADYALWLEQIKVSSSRTDK